MIGPEYVGLWDIDELLNCNKGYQILDNLSFTLAIGSNGSGEFIGIEFAGNEQYNIVLSSFIDLDKRYHICIGNSFTDFFVRLYDGKEWFS